VHDIALEAAYCGDWAFGVIPASEAKLVPPGGGDRGVWHDLDDLEYVDL
jgi:hypothetical protein